MLLQALHRGVLTCATFAILSHCNAQAPEYIEPPGFSLGVNMGLADLWGDVGTESVADHYGNRKYLNKPVFMGGISGRYTAHPSFSVRLGLNYGTLYASDAWNEENYYKATSGSDEAYFRYVRNLDVKANTWETYLMAEISPFRFSLNGRLARLRFQPHLLAGIGGFHFKPTGSDGGEWVRLDKLSLEGEGFGFAGAPEAYSLWQLSIPMGIGFRWDIGYQLSLGLDFVYRYCFFDYLDGVSGSYIDPALFDANLTGGQAAVARRMHDKSWQINPSLSKNAGDPRGSKAGNDAFSTISVSFYYKLKRRADHWW